MRQFANIEFSLQKNWREHYMKVTFVQNVAVIESS